MAKPMTWIASNPTLAVSLGLLGLFALLNVLAFRHAWTMTHYLPLGNWKGRPAPPSRLDKLRGLLSGVRVYRPRCEDRPDTFGLPYETHTLAGSQGPLEGWFLPHPQPAGLAVLFHGYLTCKARLLAEARGFFELGFCCFLVDFPGCGGSAGAVTTIGHREAADVARAVDYTRRAWPGLPLTLFGQSMGAAAVMRAMAVHNVAADAAVLECPFDRLLHTVQRRFAALGVPPFPAAYLLVFWGGLLHRYNGFAHNPAAYARRVRCPVLLLHGRDDYKVRAPEIEAVYRALSTEKHLHVFDGLGHESFAAVRPDEWKAVLASFLQSRALIC
jgi:alpha-beta hydrolase superfamily lysophospholipase